MTELPICRYRGELKDGKYPCTSPFLLVRAGGVFAETCRECHYADRVPTALEESILSQSGKGRPPCLHLGEPTGERVTCGSCGGHVEIKIRACAVHTNATEFKRVDGAMCCVGCPDYQATG